MTFLPEGLVVVIVAIVGAALLMFVLKFCVDFDGWNKKTKPPETRSGLQHIPTFKRWYCPKCDSAKAQAFRLASSRKRFCVDCFEAFLISNVTQLEEKK